MVNLKTIQAHNSTLKGLGPDLVGVFGEPMHSFPSEYHSLIQLC